VAFPSVQAQAADPCSDEGYPFSITRERTLLILWTGKIRSGMEVGLKIDFDNAKDKVDRVVLVLSSCGGDGWGMQKTVEVLRKIKQTHHLTTVVQRGATCSSACIPIFLQGTVRSAALSSIWMLHQVRTLNLADAAADTVAFQVDLAATEAAFADYFIPAGVSKRWLKRVRQKIQAGDYWQTGQNLWDSKSGIVTRPLGNLQQRDKEDRKYLMPGVVCGSFCRG
jgi:hypothetical protein